MDMVDVYQHFLRLGAKALGIYNAGFENISILEIARMVTEQVPAEIIVSESNDPRSYRQNSDKLLATGFKPQYSVKDAIRQVVEAYWAGNIMDDENCYNIKVMKRYNIC